MENWKQRIPGICQGYDPKNIFNFDETGFFFRAFPDKTLASVGDKCKGGKNAKDRITVGLTCSLAGEKLQTHINGKSLRQRCFKPGDPERYSNNYKATKKDNVTFQ